MSRTDLPAAVRAAGCSVRRPARGALPLEFDCPDVAAKVRLLNLAAVNDAKYDRRIRELAVSLIARAPDTRPEVIASKLHAAVKARVRYVGEAIETFQGAWRTWSTGLGDCDDSARLLVALARSVGVPAHIEALTNRRGIPVHACAVVAGNWAEATLDAHYGEHPLGAFRRLKAAGRPTRNVRFDLGDVGDDAGASSGPALTRQILSDAWDATPGLPPKTAAGLQMVQSIANFEGGAGVGCWSRCPGVCGNWGALQHPGSPVTHDGSVPACPPGSAPCVDSHPNADGTSTSYGVCFETYDSREAGARDYLRVLLIRHGGARAVSSGSAWEMASVMYKNKYFGGFGATDDERIGHYADAIAAQAQNVAAALGEPVMVERGGAGLLGGAGPLHLVAVGGAAVGGALVVRALWQALGRRKRKG